MTCPADTRRGFTLLELMVVVSIIVVITVISTPTIISAVDGYKLRTAAGSVAALIQNTRMRAVSDDRWYQVRTGVSGTSNYAYSALENAADAPTNESTFVMYLPRGIAFDTVGAPALDTMALDYSPPTGLPAFNARGVPCTPSGSVCHPANSGGAEGSGYVVYLRQDRPLGGTNWAAVTVSPAGRVKSWTWSGSSWN